MDFRFVPPVRGVIPSQNTLKRKTKSLSLHGELFRSRKASFHFLFCLSPAQGSYSQAHLIVAQNVTGLSPVRGELFCEIRYGHATT